MYQKFGRQDLRNPDHTIGGEEGPVLLAPQSYMIGGRLNPDTPPPPKWYGLDSGGPDGRIFDTSVKFCRHRPKLATVSKIRLLTAHDGIEN